MWEYWIQTVFAPTAKVEGMDPHQIQLTLVEQFNELGREGWELVAVHPGPKDTATAYFKRLSRVIPTDRG